MSNRMLNLRVVDAVLTGLAVGYQNETYIADVLFPLARVSKEGGKIPKFDKEHFKLFSTERAIRARSNVMQPGDRSFVDVNLEEHDISVPMDYREGEEADFDLEASNALQAEEIIRIRREFIAASLAFNAANYAASNKVTLAGGDQWTTPATSTPIDDIETAKEAVRMATGRRANTVAFGAVSWAVFKRHPQVLEAIKYTQVGIVTEELAARLLGVKKVLVGDAIYQTDAGVMTDVWGDKVWVGYVRPPVDGAKRTVYEPNFGYTAYKIIGETDKYMVDGGKVQMVRNTANFKQVIVGADAGYLISDTNA